MSNLLEFRKYEFYHAVNDKRFHMVSVGQLNTGRGLLVMHKGSKPTTGRVSIKDFSADKQMRAYINKVIDSTLADGFAWVSEAKTWTMETIQEEGEWRPVVGTFSDGAVPEEVLGMIRRGEKAQLYLIGVPNGAFPVPVNVAAVAPHIKTPDEIRHEKMTLYPHYGSW